MSRRSTPRVSECARTYIAQTYARNHSEGVRYSLRSLLTRLSVFVNDRQVGSLNAGHFESFFYDEKKGLHTTCGPTTLGKYRIELKAFLAWCYRRGYCDEPEKLLGGVVDKATRYDRPRLRLSESQLWGMVEAANDPRDRALMIFVMHTAVRISEALNVRIRDLRLETGEVWVKIIKTKGGDVFRLAPNFNDEMREWLKFYTEREHPSPDAYLFPAKWAGGYRNADGKMESRVFRYKPTCRTRNPITIFRSLATRAGVTLEPGDGWHTVRRSVARIFFDKCASRGHDAALRMTAALLHHKNTSTTEIYLGLRHEVVTRDQMMAAGFLDGPPSKENVRRLSDYRKGQ